MRIFPSEPIFSIGEVGFDGTDSENRPLDRLGRKPVGKQLSDLLERVEQPLVVALDGGWGSGKSHFLKLWVGAHHLEFGGKAKVIYFDAFEHDFLDDPLVGLVDALEKGRSSHRKSRLSIDEIKKWAIPLSKVGARVGLAAATAGLSELAAPIVDVALSKTADAVNQKLDSIWNAEAGRIAAMSKFRYSLQELTKEDGRHDQPGKLVFIVDELDRCRPDYALSLLEIIKHLFAVENVHFVLGVNLDSLENSVRVRYGAEADARTYLRKFISVSMTFPSSRSTRNLASWEVYFDSLVADMRLPTKLSECMKLNLQLYGRGHTISLRDVQRVASRIALLPEKMESWDYAYQLVGTSAVVVNLFAPEVLSTLRVGLRVWEQIESFYALDEARRLDGDPAGLLFHLWRRLLLDEPGEDTVAATARAFDNRMSQDREGHVVRLMSDLLDVFHMPADPITS